MDPSPGCTLLASSVLAGVSGYLLFKYCRKTTSKVYPPGTIVVHSFGPTTNLPSVSLFILKLETYLRMAKLKYELVISYTPGPTGKFPWIEYNGKTIGDSEICIKFLNIEKGLDLNSHLSQEEKAIGRAFQKMCEENTYWTVALDRCVFDSPKDTVSPSRHPWYIAMLLKRTVQKQTYNHGIGRHTPKEVYDILRADLEAISLYLGTKKFLFGDRPCQFDCTVFGLLAVPRWEGCGGVLTKTIEEFPNLCEYCDRVKKDFWPDWDELTLEGRKANKSQS